MTVTLCPSCSLGLLNRRPRTHSAGCWVSLMHLISIFSGAQAPSGFPRAPSAGCGFPYHISSPTGLNSTGNSTGPLGVELNWNRNSIQLARRTQLSYIIVRRSLDLWNRMFNRHQAEITVMQFRGHSLPVHQSMRVSWDFLACPILLANFRPRDFLSWLPLECITFFRCITLNGILGRVKRSKYNIWI